MMATDRRAAKAGFGDTALAAVRGAFARSHGGMGNANPYIARRRSGGESEAAWLAQCDAWWQGWDAEDKRRRGWLISTTQELASH
jgi:hypothetical protein